MYIDSLRNSYRISSFFRIETLCHSLAGNECKLFTITENVNAVLSYQDMITMHIKKDSRDRYFIMNELYKLTDDEKEERAARNLLDNKLV